MAQTPTTEDLYEGDGIQTVFALTFPYLSADEVFVAVNDVNTPYVWVGGSTASVQLAVAPAVGAEVKVYRNTKAFVPLHVFAGGVPFLPRYIDENNRQLLYVAQEAVNSTAGTAAEALIVAEEAKEIAERAEDKIDGAIIDSSFQLRTDLLANGGAARVGTARGNTVEQELAILDKRRFEFGFNVKAYGAVGDGIVDDTAAIQACLNAAAAYSGYVTTLNGLQGGYVSHVYPVIWPKGVYKITARLDCPAYMHWEGTDAVVIQHTVGVNVFDGPSAYQITIRGMHLVGGLYQVNLLNANTDVTRWTIEDCTFSLATGSAVRAFPTGGASSHLSANLVIKNCAFYKPRKILITFCDSAIVRDCWVLLNKENFAANSAPFEVGSLTCDGHPNLYLQNMFGVPVMGTFGVDRVSNPRWTDLYKGSVVATDCRFGGEDAGMAIVNYLGRPSTTYPYRGDSVSIDNCEGFAGPGASNTSGVLLLNGHPIQRFSFTNSAGPVEVPYIVNAGNQIADFPAYFANWEATTGQKAYSKFKYVIQNNDSHAPDGTVYLERLPIYLRRFTNNWRQTDVQRTTAYTPAVIPTANYINFETATFDNQGGWAAANPDRLVIPNGASRMRVTARIKVSGAFTGNLLSFQLENSSGIVVGEHCVNNPNPNTNGPAIGIDTVVSGGPGAWYRLNFRTNATTPGQILGVYVTTEAIDFIA